MIISKSMLVALLYLAGFTKNEVPTMLCIAKYESSFNTQAVNKNKNGSTDYGLFQINDRWWGHVCPVDKLLDAEYNIQCARTVFDAMGYDAWIAYRKHRGECDNATYP